MRFHRKSRESRKSVTVLSALCLCWEHNQSPAWLLPPPPHSHPTIHPFTDRVRRGSMSALRLINILDESNKRLREEHPHISCLPYAMCQNLYGIDPQHFVTYGNISPIEYNCLYHQVSQSVWDYLSIQCTQALIP